MTALDDLVTLLDLEAIEVNIFRGISPDENRQRVFGGQVAGQALVAAARTIDERGRLVHSLHAYFLRPGDPTVPILYEVDRIRDGRSFSTRRVVAIQHGKAIFNLQASFHDDEPGPDHQLTMPAGMGHPEDLDDFHTRMAPYAEQLGEWYHRPRPIDHPVRRRRPDQQEGHPVDHASTCGCAPNGTLPDDPVLHACIVTYASDMTLLDTTVLPFGLSWDSPGMQMASLDHAMWFHRPFRADEWLLYDQAALSTASSRGPGRRLDLHRRRTARRERRAGGAGAGRSADERRRSRAASCSASSRCCSSAAAAPTTTTDGADPRRRDRRRRVATAGTDGDDDRHRRRSPARRSSTVVDAATADRRRHDDDRRTARPPAAPLVDPAVELVRDRRSSTEPVEVVVRPADERLVRRRTGRAECVAVDDESDEVVLDISDLVSARRRAGAARVWRSTRRRPGLRQLHRHRRRHDRWPSTPSTRHRRVRPGAGARCSNVDQPYANHNGGKLVFGPDGMLYIGARRRRARRRPGTQRAGPRTAARQDPAHRSRPATDAEPYTVPADNPFVGVDGAAPEIWSIGLRNPWRFSLRPATGDLWIADVGQNEFEEIDVARPPTGWAGRGLELRMERVRGQPAVQRRPVTGRRTQPPVYVYSHAGGGCSVSGGVPLPRDTRCRALAGWYVFGDYCAGDVRALKIEAERRSTNEVTIGEASECVGGLGRRRRRAVRRHPRRPDLRRHCGLIVRPPVRASRHERECRSTLTRTRTSSPGVTFEPKCVKRREDRTTGCARHDRRHR